MPLRQTETLELLQRKPALVHGLRFLGNLARVQHGGRRGQGFPSRRALIKRGPPLTRNPSTPRHSAQTQKTHTGGARRCTLSTLSTRCGFISVFSRRSKAVAVCFAGLSPPDSSLPGTMDLLSCHQHHNTRTAAHKHELFLSSLLSNILGGEEKKRQRTRCDRYYWFEISFCRSTCALVYVRLRRLFMP